MHNVFHIDLLIPYVETQAYRQSYPQPPPDIIDGEEEYEVCYDTTESSDDKSLGGA